MGLFSPWFLAGIAAIGLPVWIHLLRQHKSVPRPFSSLMFFERRTQSSVKHRRLKFYALLSLRLAMILLIALLFANPFIMRKTAGAAGNKLTLIAVDRSFSMRYRNHLENAKQAALGVLPSGGKTQVIALSNRIELVTEPVSDRAALTNAIQSIMPSDGASSYGEFARFLRGLPKSTGMPVEAHLFSDMQKSSMPASFSDLALADGLKLVLHSVGEKQSPNWAVENVNAPARLFSTKKARVQATIAGYGTPAAHKTVSLVLNGKNIESKSVNVPEGGRVQVDFESLDPPYGANRGEIRIDSNDALAADDKFNFSVERTDPAKILFIHDERQTPLYFRTAIDSGAESAFDLEAVTPDQAVNLPLDKYAFAVLSAVGAAPEALEGRLRDYVSSGRGLLIALGPASLVRGRVPVTGDKIVESRYAAREGDRFQTATDIDHSHPALARSDFAGVRFYQTMRVDESNARVLARLSDRTPLVLDKKVGEGRAIIFASTFDNVSNDLPLHAAFIPFLEQTAHYLEGGEARRSSTAVASYMDLRTAHDRGAAAEVLDPDGKRALGLSESVKAKTFQFDREGFFDVRPANGRRQLVAVNADRRESDLTPVPDETLALWQGTPSGKPGVNNGNLGGEETPQSFWKYLLAALLAVAVAESVVANRFTAAATDEKREVRKQAA
jgi:hypothetical protein